MKKEWIFVEVFFCFYENKNKSRRGGMGIFIIKSQSYVEKCQRGA